MTRELQPSGRPWFRIYGDLLNDAKVQKLEPDLFKFWINLLCVASMNAGVLPAPAEVAFATRLAEPDAESKLARLVRAGLLDRRRDGFLEPHNWAARQYVSDQSTDRVRRLRERRREAERNAPGNDDGNVSCNVSGNAGNVSGNVPWNGGGGGGGDETGCNVSETLHVTRPDTESDTESSPPYPPSPIGNVSSDPIAPPAVDPVRRRREPIDVPGDDDPIPPPTRRAVPADEAAAALQRCNAAVGRPLAASQIVSGWLRDGFSLDRDILPTLRAMAAQCSRQGREMASWKYFDAAVRERRYAASAQSRFIPKGTPEYDAARTQQPYLSPQAGPGGKIGIWIVDKATGDAAKKH